MKLTLQETVQCLNAGGNVAIPTETVYGLAASLKSPEAISNIFKIKSRPLGNPLIVHVSSVKDISFAKVDLPDFDKLTHAFWPGPLSLVLPLLADLDKQVTAGLLTVAVRCPAHDLCRSLLAMTGPLVAPSANPSGKPSPTQAEHVERDYEGKVAVLDGGACRSGVESTILAWDSQIQKWVLARLGSLEALSIEKVLGYSLERRLKADVAVCPGQKWRHYAPKAELTLERPTSFEDIAVIGFNERSYKGAKIYSLGSIQSSGKCLENLYETLRRLDIDEISKAWIDLDFPLEGLWETLRERLIKASSK